ncbi:protein halfway [Plutella xylostella]|uniref:protein halfway n=1 Tax=Plutella xylostella TaxID=51655 RepID=UPI002032E7C9|nr:protein halfway [Plutella xylostella]
MTSKHFSFFDVSAWGLVLCLLLLVPALETRVDELEQAALKYREQQPPPPTPAPPPPPASPRCFHRSRADCPTDSLKCKLVDPTSVFCCDVDSFRLREGLGATMTQNITNLHVLNAEVDELDISQSVYRRLTSMALTDGNIGKITGQFRKYSSIACLNISNNNLSSATFQPSVRPFAYLYNLSVLDASANNLTEFPLSLVHSNRKISVDLSGNKYLPCKHFQRAMESNNSSLVTFANYNKTYCALDLRFNWFKDVQIVQIDHLRVQRELNASCRNIKPSSVVCTCVAERLELLAGEVTNSVAVDCSRRHLKEMPLNLPLNTVKLNVSYNNITSLQAVGDDPSYEHLRQLIADHNDIPNIVELEGTKFIDNFMLFSINHNKLKTIHTYVLSNKFDTTGPYTTVSLAGNYIHCDCNTEKVLKPWLAENSKYITDYKSLECQDGLGPVYDLAEFQVCHTPRDWTDYIYYIIGLEVLTLVLLISKVSYDYWVFKTAGYLPWPANKMPRLPCDWLCE